MKKLIAPLRKQRCTFEGISLADVIATAREESVDGNYALNGVARIAHRDTDRAAIYQTMMDGSAVRVNSSIRLHCQCDYNRGNYTLFAINCILLLLSITYFSCAQNAVISKYNFADCCL